MSFLTERKSAEAVLVANDNALRERLSLPTTSVSLHGRPTGFENYRRSDTFHSA
jgi:hypothetical protein